MAIRSCVKRSKIFIFTKAVFGLLAEICGEFAFEADRALPVFDAVLAALGGWEGWDTNDLGLSSSERLVLAYVTVCP